MWVVYMCVCIKVRKERARRGRGEGAIIVERRQNFTFTLKGVCVSKRYYLKCRYNVDNVLLRTDRTEMTGVAKSVSEWVCLGFKLIKINQISDRPANCMASSSLLVIAKGIAPLTIIPSSSSSSPSSSSSESNASPPSFSLPPPRPARRDRPRVRHHPSPPPPQQLKEERAGAIFNTCCSISSRLLPFVSGTLR